MKHQRGYISWSAGEAWAVVAILAISGYGAIRGIEWLLSKITLSVGWV